jgi:hypothetical protein
VITEGYEFGRKESLKYLFNIYCNRFLDSFKFKVGEIDTVVLLNVVRTALCTKLQPEMANHMIPLLVEAV